MPQEDEGSGREEGFAFALRPATAEDAPFIIDSWVRSYARSPHAKACGEVAYHAGHRQLVAHLLRSATVLVACLPDDADTVLGWSCTGDGAVFYVFVKHDFRRLGIARALVAPYLDPSRDVVHTHSTIHRIALPEHWRFDPYAHFPGFKPWPLSKASNTATPFPTPEAPAASALPA